MNFKFCQCKITTICKNVDMHKKQLKFNADMPRFCAALTNARTEEELCTSEVVFTFFTGRLHQAPSVSLLRYNIPTAFLKLSAISFFWRAFENHCSCSSI